ncbi:hypothetical protein GDO81_028999 [Engystomops pustulosus]|uniref:Uncharacterized protein n=1 Tax=Engystomops pustulosus TaxID=76066 RepID=A0AAV6YX02_ENGPU|nr:hypothetical protein GDO81_029062 [Engystomops pustulosus]KAG8541462.1 hypothetical protein GDO81_028999 [Engystomops pustulosus]
MRSAALAVSLSPGPSRVCPGPRVPSLLPSRYRLSPFPPPLPGQADVLQEATGLRCCPDLLLFSLLLEPGLRVVAGGSRSALINGHR